MKMWPKVGSRWSVRDERIIKITAVLGACIYYVCEDDPKREEFYCAKDHWWINDDITLVESGLERAWNKLK